LYKQGTQNLIAYAYDALGRRILENPNSPRTLYYSSSWQVLEEDVSGNAKDQNVWSPIYADALVERDRDPNNSGVLSERFYVQQDANWNVAAIIDTTGAVQERYVYDPYGSPTILDPNWNTRGIGSGSLYAWVYLHQVANAGNARVGKDSLDEGGPLVDTVPPGKVKRYLLREGERMVIVPVEPANNPGC
jgi:hypothetical protein